VAQILHTKKQFVLRDTSAEVVKSLSQNELALWMTMRRLADAKTGALYFHGKWIRAERIQREAKMGKTRRKETMKTLVVKGLVRIQQDHSVRDIADRLSGHVRKRFVFKEVQYWVNEIPRQDWVSSAGRSKKTPKLRVSSAGRNEKKPSAGRFLSQHKNRPINSHNPPDAGSSGPVGDRRLSGYGERSENHQGNTNGDRLDDLKKKVLAECTDPNGDLATALDVIIERVKRAGINVTSAKYLEVALQRFDFQTGQDREDWMAASRGRIGVR
jgi:hypothetical protein